MKSKIIQFPSTSRPRLTASPSTAPPTPTSNVTFTRPFQLPGMDRPHQPGTFEIVATKDALDVVWEAYRISTRIILTDGLLTEALDVTADDLANALAKDALDGR
jgi:hypothetical protein